MGAGCALICQRPFCGLLWASEGRWRWWAGCPDPPLLRLSVWALECLRGNVSGGLQRRRCPSGPAVIGGAGVCRWPAQIGIQRDVAALLVLGVWRSWCGAVPRVMVRCEAAYIRAAPLALSYLLAVAVVRLWQGLALSVVPLSSAPCWWEGRETGGRYASAASWWWPGWRSSSSGTYSRMSPGWQCSNSHTVAKLLNDMPPPWRNLVTVDCPNGRCSTGAVKMRYVDHPAAFRASSTSIL